MAIRCIALDMDYTTLDRMGRLSPSNRAALERAIQKGIHIVIASGRSRISLPADVLAVPGIEYAVTSNGAAVYYLPTGQCLHRALLTPDSVERVLSLTADEDVAYETIVADKIYSDVAYVEDPMSYGADAQAAKYVQTTRHPKADMPSFLRAHKQELVGVDLVVRSQADKARLWALLEREVPEVYVTSSIQRLLELGHRDAGKHNGLRLVLERLGLSRSETAAFGDGDNDVEMLSFAGVGIAMANATPACLQAADFVTKSNSEDGVAWGMERFLGI